jgi:hypothetical protein
MTYLNAAHLVIVLGLAVRACAPHGPADPTDQVRNEDAGCAEACARMRALECELGEPTNHGAECEEVCLNVMEGPRQIHWDLPCLASTMKCAGCDGKDPLQ